MTPIDAGESAGFDDLDPDPIVQFARWFDEARATPGIAEPSAMAIATNGPIGPSVRMVLLRRYDGTGFCFFTNLQSQKGRELLADPHAAATIYWDPLNRQVRIVGLVEQVSAEESDDYFASRARGSQVAAWASDQSQPIESRAQLEARYRAAEKRFGDGPVPRPPHWGGFRLVPRQIEFWQGRPNRLHDRLLYEHDADGTWTRQRLMP